jgi:hypothetical protein
MRRGKKTKTVLLNVMEMLVAGGKGDKYRIGVSDMPNCYG